MKFRALAAAIMLLGMASQAEAKRPGQANDFRQLSRIEPLPVALDSDFEFRKTKLFVMGSLAGRKKAAAVTQSAPKSPSIAAESAYRLFGAVTELDKRARYGHYFDFFWRGKRPEPVTVRLEYRQDLLRAFTQAREVDYPNGNGSHKTAFAIIGDDFFNDGRVNAWRCLLIVRGRIVAENRSYLWR